MSVFSPRATLCPSVFVGLVLATAPLTFSQAVEETAKELPAQTGRQSGAAHDVDRQNEATTRSESPKVPIHIVPYGAGKIAPEKQSGPAGTLSNNGKVQYWGGPVISNVHVVEVLWGNFVDSASTNGLEQFYTDITQSPYFELLEEYSTVGLNGFGTGTPGSNQIIGPGVFDGPRIVINPSTCPGGSGNPACTITDAQIQNEIVRQLNSHALPAPVQDNQGNFNTIYMIYFPPGVTISLGGHDSCAVGGFCAYHSNLSGSPQVPYGVYPDFSQGGCSAVARGCGFATAFENLTTASSHELGEAVTDVDVGSGNTFAPPLAWVDQNTGEEIGDFCVGQQVQVTANSHTYTVQRLMSNIQGSVCESAPPNFQVQPATANAVPGGPFQVIVSAHADGGPLLTAYNDTIHFTSSDVVAGLPADYTFVPGTDNGSHTFTVTLNTTGSQTISVKDTVITAMIGSATVDAEHNPDLAVASTHSGSFSQSQMGVTYTLTVTNVGDRPTNGNTVTVTDNLPTFAFAATGMSGTGWNCTVGTLTCTRSDALMNGQSYPPITLTANVFSNAPPTITNSVTVSGGGELNTSNDTGTDPTTIIQLPNPVVFISHIGNFTEGEIGESYTISVHNFGFAPTSGTVTVVDTLPSLLTATAISGTGWSCTLGSLTCTRSDPLASGGVASYPPITLTVNVGSLSPVPPSVTNTATVSGGGEAPNPPNTGTDLTLITAPASDLVVSSTHTSDFTQGQSGAVYTLTASNIGPLPTAGTVTVNDNLPSVFTLTSMTGSNWACNLGPPPTCTRSDALPGNTGAGPGAYPPITLTVNVSPTAFTPQTNSAVVSGGGEANTGNDTSNDVTNVIQLPDLLVVQATPVLAQGFTGANFVLTVTNIGQGQTSAPVTVTDTLPASLTATAMSGQGWNCTLGTLTCTRSDVLGGTSSYPPITLTVNVALNAPSSVVTTATVSGGGEIITSNDTSTVATQVLPPVSVSVFFSSGTVSAGGSAQYQLTINAPAPGQITTACTAGVPPGAACIITPTPLTAPFNGSVFVAVTTTRAGLAQGLPDRMPPVYAALMPVLGVVILMTTGRRNRSQKRLFIGLRGLTLVLLLSGCGGGGSSGPPPPTATPPGTYTITVTVSNTTVNSQVTTPLTLIVK
jgi:uncharacterized repeat protein (TIGR01451 family)